LLMLWPRLFRDDDERVRSKAVATNEFAQHITVGSVMAK
jgi:hypothetical protein